MGEAYLRRRYGVIALPPISITDRISATVGLDADYLFRQLKYDAADSITDQFGIDADYQYDKLLYTNDSITDQFGLDVDYQYDVLIYTFENVTDQFGIDIDYQYDVLIYTFENVTDNFGLDIDYQYNKLIYTFENVTDNFGLDVDYQYDVNIYPFDNITDNVGLDIDYQYDVILTNVQPPILGNVINIGQETASITVENTNDFFVRIYFSLTNASGQPNTTNDFITLNPAGEPGSVSTVLIHNYFTLQGNRSYTFYARAYDLDLNDQSGIVSKPFTTLKYNFTNNPAWVAQNLQVSQTAIEFSYKNENAVNATLSVAVRDSGGSQAMDLLVENINAGQTLIFNSNDYNDSFSAGQTYTFDAIFTKVDYNNSGSTINNVTTTAATPTTDTPSILNVDPAQTSVNFDLRNNDGSTATITYGLDSNNLGNPVSVGSGLSVNRTISSLSAGTPYTIYARAQASGELISGLASSPFTTDSPPPTPTTATPTISNVNPDGTSVTFNLTNNDGSTATIFYEINDTTPDANSDVVGSGGTILRSLSGLNYSTTYTIYATAQASGELLSGLASATFTTDAEPPPPPPQTAAPTITVVSTTETSVTYSITNNDSSQATIVYEINDPTPDASSIVVSGFGSTGNITNSGLTGNTTYTIYATAQASGETISNVSSASFTTDPPPSVTYTLRARSNGVSQVGVTIGGVSYTLTTSYQNVDTTASSKTTSLSAPIDIVISGTTYNFASWHNMTTNTTISTNRNTSITWSSNTDIEARYIPGGFGFG